MAFASLSEMLELVHALEQDVRERDETLLAMQGHVAELAAFRQEALTLRERDARQQQRIAQLEDQLAKAQNAISEARAEADGLRRQVEADVDLVREAREISDSVRDLARKVRR